MIKLENVTHTETRQLFISNIKPYKYINIIMRIFIQIMYVKLYKITLGTNLASHFKYVT